MFFIKIVNTDALATTGKEVQCLIKGYKMFYTGVASLAISSKHALLLW